MSHSYRPAYHATETQLVTYHRLPERDPEAWRAICAWCEAHGMDPHKMPAANVIVRNLEQRRVEFDALVFDDEGRIERLPGVDQVRQVRAVAQGETPPMPWPDVIARQLR